MTNCRGGRLCPPDRADTEFVLYGLLGKASLWFITGLAGYKTTALCVMLNLFQHLGIPFYIHGLYLKNRHLRFRSKFGMTNCAGVYPPLGGVAEIRAGFSIKARNDDD
ncbi:hypothetical protein ACFLXA_03435 [Chloroflexota bacterium]